MRRRLLLPGLLVAFLGSAGCQRVEIDRVDVVELPGAGQALAQEPSPHPAGTTAPARASERRRPAEEASSPTYYRYTDDAGSLRFVSSLEQVPPRLRDRARPVGGSVTRTQSAPARSATRPFAVEADALAGRRGGSQVVVYTAPWCGWCRKTLSWLDERGVPYDNRDIDRHQGYRRELVSRSGGTSIPYVEIDGSPIRGYSPERMARLLGD